MDDDPSNSPVESNIANNKPEDMVEDYKMGGKYTDPNLFAADRLISKMADNLAVSEALTDERPLITENTDRLMKNDD
jgi:hypothetical protein